MEAHAQRAADPTRALRAAVEADDPAAMQAALTRACASVPRRVIERLASDAMRRQRWASAAAVIEHLSASDQLNEPSREPITGTGETDDQARLRLCRNLAAIQTHRPELHAVLMSASQASQCTLMRARDGRPTLVQTLPGGQPTCLTPGMAVDKALAAALEHLTPAQAHGYPVALLGVGDGYLLDRLAREPRELTHGCAQAVYVIEPDAEVLLTSLMLHDYTGPTGPIEQARFYWAVGSDASEQLRGWLEADSGLHPPMRTVTQSVRGPALEPAVAAVSRQLTEGDQALQRRVHERYASLTRDALTARLRGEGDCPPRVLLLTSRFTSVLQYATRDAAEAFERLGWETRTLIEPSAHTRVTPRMVAAALLDFEPDVVFQIDHLRYEMPGLFPPELPFVCWIQDNVASLTRVEAGESLGERDFVLTNSIHLYTTTYRYPTRQCIYLNKLTRSVAPPTDGANGAAGDEAGEDLVFVSHGSRAPARLAAELTELVPDANGKRLMAAACERLIAVYAGGGCVLSTQQTERLLDEAEDDTGVRVRDAKLRRGLVQNLFDTLNNTLYRQQALEWATSIAETMGLSVGLYGQGWDEHPRFARWARGPVAYGRPLEALTRRSKVCLQIVPYQCLHQRLLDGWIAGGFFLVRLYEPEMAYGRMIRLIHERVPAAADDYPAALEQLDEPDRAELTRCWRHWAALTDKPEAPTPETDPVRHLREHQRRGTTFLLELPPRLEEVGFTDRDTLEARIRRFIDAPERRRAVADEQRRFVAAHHTYERGLARVVDAIAELVSQETQGPNLPDNPPDAAPPHPPLESDGPR